MPDLLDQLDFRNDTRPLQMLGEAGFLWSYLGRWKEAEDVFRALMVLVPNDPCAYLGMAEMALMQNQHAHAQRYGEQAAKIAITRPNPNQSDRHTAARAYCVAAKALIQQKKPQLAQVALTKAIELDPQGPAGQHARDLLQSGKLVGAVE